MYMSLEVWALGRNRAKWVGGRKKLWQIGGNLESQSLADHGTNRTGYEYRNEVVREERRFLAENRLEWGIDPNNKVMATGMATNRKQQQSSANSVSSPPIGFRPPKNRPSLIDCENATQRQNRGSGDRLASARVARFV